MTISPRIGDKLRVTGAFLAVVAVLATFSPFTDEVGASTTVTQTFPYTGSVSTFTVPEGVSSIAVTLTGGQGGKGGPDTQGVPTPGGYRGVVSGQIAVIAGQEITIAVGGGGADGFKGSNLIGGSGGLNPLSGYDGARGGRSGPNGGSGAGGGSGAATVIRIDGNDVVAAGAGGNGGNGQFFPVIGRRAEADHLSRADTTSTNGRDGIDTGTVCSPGYNCDGGGGGAGGAGAQGGERGEVQYGGDTATEYFGFGGYPGSNSKAGLSDLSSFFEYYPANRAHGSVVISYDSGTPGAPTGLSATPRSGAVDLAWAEPASSGSASISDYIVEYATNKAGPYQVFADGTSTNLAATVAGLTNGTNYFFRVSAVNSYGSGPHSTVMAIGVMPSDVPNASTVNSLVPFDSGLYVDFTQGSTDSPVLSHEYRLDGGSWTTTTASLNRLTIPGLINGRSYQVEIRAVNAIGASARSASMSGTPRSAASAPTALTAAGSNTTVSLTWAAPSNDNGSAVSDYRIEVGTSITGPFTTFADGVSTDNSTVVTGLTNGTTYFLRVAAINGAGVGAFSSPIGSTPFTKPGTSNISGVVGQDGALSVQFAPPSDGGSTITGYEYSLDSGGHWLSTGWPTTPFQIPGLTNGTAYDVSMRAINAAGAGASSATVAGTPRTVPAAPSISTIALDTGAVSVAFSTGSDGGSPITNFEYSTDGGTNWTPRTPASSSNPLTIAGLVGGQTYPIALRAVNAAGASATSNQSSVTAKGTPEGPSIGSIVASDRALTVAFDSPPNGGTPITNYEYSLDGGSWISRVPAAPSSPIVISGLTNGSAYSVRIRAVNAIGSGAASAAVSATPRTVPGAPRIDSDTIVGMGGDLDVIFTAPSSNGGSAITNYQYSTDAGATWRNRSAGDTSSPLTISTLSIDGTTPLTGGDTYPVEIRAVNAAGPGAASAMASGMTRTIPGAPVIGSVTSDDSSASVSIAIPANGGSDITRFDYRLDGGSWTSTGTLSDEFRIEGLNNSTSYVLEVRAVNAVGFGPNSSTRAFTVRRTADAPAVSLVTPGDRTLSLQFAPNSDGGSAITGYEYSTDGGATWRARSPQSTESPVVITTESNAGAATLVNGKLYAIQLRAVNTSGSGVASASMLAAPRGVPSAPGSFALTGGDGKLIASFVAGSDGGSAIIAVEYRLDGGAWTDSGSLSSPFTVSGLTNGTQYALEMRLRNSIGAGPVSPLVNGTPRTAPSQPRLVSVAIGDSSSQVSWTASVSDGGAPIHEYVATAYDQPVRGLPIASCRTTLTTCEIVGLDNGVTYYASVVALNVAGTSSPSEPRTAVTPLAAATVSIATSADGANAIAVVVTVDDDGGAPISSYEYRLDGGGWTSAATASSPFSISKLETGRSYSVEVRAVNVMGPGPASASKTAIPHTTPGAPTSLVAASGPAQAGLSWTAPASNGGQPITDYVIEYATSVSGPFIMFADGVSADPTATVTGLLNGTPYVFRVAAVNTAGSGSNSALASATPIAPPNKPTIATVTSGSRYLQVAFTAGSGTGGSPLTGYEYQLDGGTWRKAAASTSPIQISGLENGQTYQVALRSTNAAGASISSNIVSGKPYGVPGAVRGFLGRPGSGTAELTWEPVNGNGADAVTYNVIRWTAANEGGIAASYQTTATSHTVNGLGSGSYYFTIEATNLAGTGPRSSPRTSVRVGSVAPGAPTIAPVTITGSAVSMQWSNGAVGSAAATGYVVQYSSDGAAFTTVLNGATPANTAEFSIPEGVTLRYLRVATISPVGLGDWATVRPPSVATGAVSGVASQAASVATSANANGSTAQVAVQYATSVANLTGGSAIEIQSDPSEVTGSSSTDGFAQLTALDPATTYHARSKVSSPAGITYGEIVSFTTAVSITSSGLDPVYDGTPVGITTTITPSGVSVSRTFEGTGETSYGPSSVAPTGVGTYKLTTVADGGFSGTEVADLTVHPKALDATVSVAAKVYDGTTSATLSVTIGGVIDGDDVGVRGSALVGSFSDRDAGADKTVTVTADSPSLEGDDAKNYSTVFPTEVMASISRAGQTVSFTSSAPSPFRADATYRPTMESSAGLDVNVVLDEDSEASCSLTDGTVTAIAPGTCVLVATQVGNSNIDPARAVTQRISVLPIEEVPPPTTTTVPGPKPSDPKPPSSTVPAPRPGGPEATTPRAPAPKASGFGSSGSGSSGFVGSRFGTNGFDSSTPGTGTASSASDGASSTDKSTGRSRASADEVEGGESTAGSDAQREEEAARLAMIDSRSSTTSTGLWIAGLVVAACALISAINVISRRRRQAR